MTRAFVADASVAVGWVHPGQTTKSTTAMLDAIADGATLEVPALWPLEVANALLVLVRRRKLTEADRQAGLGWLAGLRLRLDHEMAPLAWSRLSELAAAHHLSVYDAAYLELAQRRKLVLGCKDGPCGRRQTRPAWPSGSSFNRSAPAVRAGATAASARCRCDLGNHRLRNRHIRWAQRGQPLDDGLRDVNSRRHSGYS